MVAISERPAHHHVDADKKVERGYRLSSLGGSFCSSQAAGALLADFVLQAPGIRGRLKSDATPKPISVNYA